MGKQGTYGQPSHLSSVTLLQKLHRLLNMRRRAKVTGSIDVLAVPGLWVPVGLVGRLKTSLDIRSLYILLILSFVDDSAASSVKTSFLEQRHDIFRSIFGGIDQDPYTLARKILEVAWTGIWLDPKIKRTVKVNVFNEACLHLVRRISLALSAPSRTTRFRNSTDAPTVKVPAIRFLLILRITSSSLSAHTLAWEYVSRTVAGIRVKPGMPCLPRAVMMRQLPKMHAFIIRYWHNCSNP